MDSWVFYSLSDQCAQLIFLPMICFYIFTSYCAEYSSIRFYYHLFASPISQTDRFSFAVLANLKVIFIDTF